MPFNGSGSFSPYTPGNPAVSGTTISSTAFNNTVTDFAAGLSNAMTRDGQSPATANIPMGGKKITGLGDGTATTDAATFGQAGQLGAYLPDGTGAVATTVQAKLRERVSVKDFGAVGDFDGTTGTDNYAAFMAAINSFPNTWDGNGYSFAGEVIIPPGKYYLSQTLTLHRQVKLIGSGSPAGNALSNCQLWFADNINGIVIFYEYAATPNDGADGTVLSGFSINNRKNAGGTLGSGIVMNARAELKNLLIQRFRVDGIQIFADTSVSPFYNANSWKISNCVSISNDRHGFYVKGGDANAGTCISLDSRSNGGVGIYESSFLGNTYLGCHTAANVTNGYKSDNINSRSVFVGCYSEGGETQSIASPSMVLGGILGTSLSAIGTAQVVAEGNQTTTTLTASTDSNAILQIGGAYGTTGGVLALKDQSEVSGAWPFRLIRNVGGWVINWANAANPIFRLTNSQATIANGYARDTQNVPSLAASGGIAFNNGFMFGSGLKYVQSLSAAPASGTYVVGDIVFNSSPTASGFVGWVCTTAGTPGTWKTFGAISA